MNTAKTLQKISTERCDLELQGLVKQVCEITGSSHDVAVTTLFDCNYDVGRAVDKIFEIGNDGVIEGEEKERDVWKEVAKVRRKVAAGDIVIVEDIESECKVEEDPRERRAIKYSGRGRTRNGRGSDLYVPGRVKRNQGSRTNNKEQETYTCVAEENHTEKIDNRVRLIDEEIGSTAIVSGNDCAAEFSNITLAEDSAVDIVANLTNKEGVFGDFSRTKAPPPSSILATMPIKLVTSTGVISLPSSVFNFGLNFSEYCINNKDMKNSGNTVNDENSNLIKQEKEENMPVENYRKFYNTHDEIKKDYVNHNDIILKDGLDTRNFDDVESRRINIPHKGNYDRYPSSMASFSSSLPTNHTTYTSDTTFLPTMLSSSPQLCPPPGMSNAHILQQLHHNPQHYLSLMNLPSGPSLYDIVSSTNDNPQFVHSLLNNKEFLSKNTKTNEQDQSNIINAMQMPNICCFPQMYMNNLANFLPTITDNHCNVSVESSQDISLSSNNNPSISSNTTSHRNYSTDSAKYEDIVVTSKQKYVRPSNYVTNISTGADGCLKEDGKPDKNNIHSMTPAVNRQMQSQQTVSNDPRFLAFHQHLNNTYRNNMFNCVTATGSHTHGAHPYTMAHQSGNLQQLQLMQQQIDNFPHSYQFQEHLMTSMVPNSNNRNNTSSNTNQSTRNNRSNTLWHPSK